MPVFLTLLEAKNTIITVFEDYKVKRISKKCYENRNPALLCIIVKKDEYDSL